MRTDFGQRFWSRVGQPNERGCWLWLGQRAGNGYGAIKAEGKQTSAHRMMWALWCGWGSIPDGRAVLHRCDVKHCVNPEHLFLGSISDNARDCVLKFRHANKKLQSEDVLEIRRRCAAGESQASVGRAFGVRRDHVSRIMSGECWSYLPTEEPCIQTKSRQP